MRLLDDEQKRDMAARLQEIFQLNISDANLRLLAESSNGTAYHLILAFQRLAAQGARSGCGRCSQHHAPIAGRAVGEYPRRAWREKSRRWKRC
jgi:hypothetical protein